MNFQTLNFCSIAFSNIELVQMLLAILCLLFQLTLGGLPYNSTASYFASVTGSFCNKTVAGRFGFKASPYYLVMICADQPSVSMFCHTYVYYLGWKGFPCFIQPQNNDNGCWSYPT